jgi:hypothetical protein
MSSKPDNKNLLFWQYIALPLIFLLVTLLGGLRLSLETGAFIFLGPTLFNLVLAVMLAAIVLRGKLIKVGQLISPEFPVLKNLANGLILLTLFSASVQVINSVLPEKGLAFGLTAFFLLWTLWTNLFAELERNKLLRSLAALFGLAFVFKYVFLASLVSASSGEESWARKLAESLLQGVSLGLLEIPKFSGLTGYAAFFTILLYGAGLLLLSSLSNGDSKEMSAKTPSETTS